MCRLLHARRWLHHHQTALPAKSRSWQWRYGFEHPLLSPTRARFLSACRRTRRRPPKIPFEADTPLTSVVFAEFGDRRICKLQSLCQDSSPLDSLSLSAAIDRTKLWHPVVLKHRLHPRSTSLRQRPLMYWDGRVNHDIRVRNKINSAHYQLRHAERVKNCGETVGDILSADFDWTVQR